MERFLGPAFLECDVSRDHGHSTLDPIRALAYCKCFLDVSSCHSRVSLFQFDTGAPSKAERFEICLIFESDLSQHANAAVDLCIGLFKTTIFHVCPRQSVHSQERFVLSAPYS